jgi:hypothetical protein
MTTFNDAEAGVSVRSKINTTITTVDGLNSGDNNLVTAAEKTVIGNTSGTNTGDQSQEGTAVLSTGEVGGTKFLREDGDGTSSWQTIAAGGDVTGPASAVDNRIATFDLTTGKLIQDSGVLVTDVLTNTGGASVTLSGDGTELITTDVTPTADTVAYFDVNKDLLSGINKDSAATCSFQFMLDGGGAALTTGIKGTWIAPYAFTITENTILTDQSGSIVVDVWKDVYANYPPTNADSITASAPPTISTSNKAQDSTLTGWTTAVAQGDIFYFNIDSITTCEWALLEIRGTIT